MSIGGSQYGAYARLVKSPRRAAKTCSDHAFGLIRVRGVPFPHRQQASIQDRQFGCWLPTPLRARKMTPQLPGRRLGGRWSQTLK
jgi:hypothetical protein